MSLTQSELNSFLTLLDLDALPLLAAIRAKAADRTAAIRHAAMVRVTALPPSVRQLSMHTLINRYNGDTQAAFIDITKNQIRPHPSNQQELQSPRKRKRAGPASPATSRNEPEEPTVVAKKSKPAHSPTVLRNPSSRSNTNAASKPSKASTSKSRLPPLSLPQPESTFGTTDFNYAPAQDAIEFERKWAETMKNLRKDMAGLGEKERGDIMGRWLNGP